MNGDRFEQTFVEDLERQVKATQGANAKILEDMVLDAGVKVWRLREQSETFKTAGVEARNAGDMITAKKNLQEAIEIDQKASSVIEDARRAMLQRSDPMTQADLTQYQKLIQSRDISLAQSCMLLAEIYEKEKDYGKRNAYCELGIRVFQGSRDPAAFLCFIAGCLYYYQDGDFPQITRGNGEKSIACFEASIKKSAGSVAAMDKKAYMFSNERLGYIYQDSPVFQNTTKAYQCFYDGNAHGLSCEDVLARYKKTMFGKIKFLGWK